MVRRVNTSERGEVQAYRDDGTWKLRVVLDEWIINDIQRDAANTDIRFTVSTAQGGEMVLTQEKLQQ